MKYYCIGIKGAGMSTLAQILHDLGHDVSGYDDARKYKFTQKGLEERNIPIYYDGLHSIDQDTIVTYSVAFSNDHPEIKRVKDLNLKMKKYNEIIGDIIDLFCSIGVSGTHGKTTTSSIIKHIISSVEECSYFIGAGDGYVNSKNNYFVVESDEFNRHFTAYKPVYSIITNIEEEHLECYKDIEDIRNTFEIFANQTKRLVVANGDNEQILKMNFKVPVKYYGFNEENDICIKNMQLTDSGSSFDLFIDGKFYNSFDLPFYGEHMVTNAAAAIGLANELGIDKDIIKKSLGSFKNAKRRFAEEFFDNIVIIDDYAHHPTEIKVTLGAVRQKYPLKRLVAVFKPNTYSRTRDFTNEFVDALSIADKVYLTEIDSNREKQDDYPNVTSNLILDKIVDSEIIGEDSIDKLRKETDAVICFMSCASIESLISAYKDTIKK